MSYERITPDFNKDKIFSIEEKIEQLKLITPEAFADGKINFDTLKEILGENLEEEKGEHFGLFWPGKREARRLAVMPSKGTLVPCHGEGINEDNTNNIFIEGDNLEVLKLLQKSYAGKIKMIYIDPPYNTGNDFVYDDNYAEPLEDYLMKTGQLDGERKPLTTNTMADGRFHSKWLCMMYPRLRLARNLLRDDGVIFISIDDNEVNNLRQMMNEIFGEENFFAQIVIQSNKRGQTYKQISKTHEYLLIYIKTDEAEINELEKEADDLKYTDDIGKFDIRELRNRNPKFGKFNRPNLFYPIYINHIKTDNDGFCPVSLERSKDYNVECNPLNSEGKDSCWRWGKKLLLQNINSNTQKSNIVAKEKTNGGYNIYEKYRKTTYKAKSIWDETNVITEQGTIELGELGLKGVFDFPKPVNLIKKAILLGADKDDIILDFFAGSGTTAHSLLENNIENNSNCSFILIQLPEILDEKKESTKNANKLKLYTLADITKERIRRVCNNIDKEIKKSNKIEDSKFSVSANTQNGIGLGFKVLKLEKSNFKQWNDFEGKDVDKLHKQLDIFENKLISGWKEKNLITELMLLEGMQLDSSVQKLKGINTNKVIKVSSDSSIYSLHICTDEKINLKTIDALNLQKEDRFICLDSSLTDSLKMHLSDICQLKTI